MRHEPETRELAFQEWYAGGMIDERTAAAMEDKHGYVINAKTIAAWRKNYGWAERAAKIDLTKQSIADAVLTSDEQLLQSSYEQKKRYDRLFARFDNEDVDAKEMNSYTQAMHAYTTLLGFIEKLEDKIAIKSGKKKPEQTSAGLDEATAADIRDKILGLK